MCQRRPEGYSPPGSKPSSPHYLRPTSPHAAAAGAVGGGDVRDSTTGRDHPETARALTNLARLALHAGRADVTAEPLLRRALAIQEQELAPDHPDTALTLAVIGGYHQATATCAAAEPYFRHGAGDPRARAGREHPLTLGTTGEPGRGAGRTWPAGRGRAAVPTRARLRASAAPERAPRDRPRVDRIGRGAGEEGQPCRSRAADAPRAGGAAAVAGRATIPTPA